ncbi:MAG TPA: hypothetical protein VK670_06170 [Silvibacterium sp.]|nr:hypothetical protein [Silvibacterium sp.]
MAQAHLLMQITGGTIMTLILRNQHPGLLLKSIQRWPPADFHSWAERSQFCVRGVASKRSAC